MVALDLHDTLAHLAEKGLEPESPPETVLDWLGEIGETLARIEVLVAVIAAAKDLPVSQ